MIILEKGERADPLWGMDTEIITDEMIEALQQGKRLYLSVNNEYAVVIKKDGKRKTDKPEHTRCKRLIDADAFKAYMKDALEQTRNAYTDGGEWAQTITEQFCKDIDEQPTIEFDSDTISRHDAIEHLKKRLYESALNNEGVVSETMEEIADNRIQIWMDELPPSPSRPPWIPCSERLPEVTVLCCDTRGEMIIGYLYQDEESNTGYSAVLDDVVMIDCIAWMPLPEPYHRP